MPKAHIKIQQGQYILQVTVEVQQKRPVEYLVEQQASSITSTEELKAQPALVLSKWFDDDFPREAYDPIANAWNLEAVQFLADKYFQRLREIEANEYIDPSSMN